MHVTHDQIQNVQAAAHNNYYNNYYSEVVLFELRQSMVEKESFLVKIQ